MDGDELLKLWMDHYYDQSYKNETERNEGAEKKESEEKKKITKKSTSTSSLKSITESKKSEYDKKTVAELKQLCKERGLKMTGTKANLIERLSQPTIETMIKKKPTHKKMANVLQKIIHNAHTLNIRRNVFGNYEHADTGFIFDELTHTVIGKQNESIDPMTNSPTIEPLTEKDIELCKEYNFKYKLPDTIV